LVTADPGEESEINVPKGVRYLTVQEVRTFDGPTSLLSTTQKPNFRIMVLRLLGRTNSIAVQNLRAFVNSLTKGPLAEEVRSIEGGLSQEIDERSTGALAGDPTWLEKWQGVNLGDSETSSLSHQFFTRTTSKQENALNNPRGLTFVEGIAGSGKTSIALGRLKFFANFGTGEERSHYGLGNAGANDFSPTNMAGFVLSHELADAQIDTDQTNFKLRGLADHLINAAMTAEFRAREASIQERISRETDRNIRYDLRNELERVAKEEERHSISSLGRTLLGLINIGDLIDIVAKSGDLESLARKSFENQTDFTVQDINDAVAAFKSEMSSEDAKLRTVTDPDLVALIILSAMVAEGFDRLDAPLMRYVLHLYPDVSELS
jgi:hypothetical protein